MGGEKLVNLHFSKTSVTLFYGMTRDSKANHFVINFYCRCLKILCQIAINCKIYSNQLSRAETIRGNTVYVLKFYVLKENLNDKSTFLKITYQIVTICHVKMNLQKGVWYGNDTGNNNLLTCSEMVTFPVFPTYAHRKQSKRKINWVNATKRHQFLMSCLFCVLHFTSLCNNFGQENNW